MLAAVYAQLQADVPLVTLVGGRIYNHVPQDTPFPYVRVRLDAMAEWDTKQDFGYNGDVYCDAWSAKQGDLQPLQIADALREALHDKPLTLPEGQCVCLRHLAVSIFVEPDGQAHHIVTRFRTFLSE